MSTVRIAIVANLNHPWANDQVRNWAPIYWLVLTVADDLSGYQFQKPKRNCTFWSQKCKQASGHPQWSLHNFLLLIGKPQRETSARSYGYRTGGYPTTIAWFGSSIQKRVLLISNSFYPWIKTCSCPLVLLNAYCFIESEGGWIPISALAFLWSRRRHP